MKRCTPEVVIKLEATLLILFCRSLWNLKKIPAIFGYFSILVIFSVPFLFSLIFFRVDYVGLHWYSLVNTNSHCRWICIPDDSKKTTKDNEKKYWKDKIIKMAPGWNTNDMWSRNTITRYDDENTIVINNNVGLLSI